MRYTLFAAALAAALGLTGASYAAPIYSNDFEVDDTANWTLNNGPSDAAANFFFDYSTAGIPLAPNSAPDADPRGLKLQANQANGIFSGMSVSPTGLSYSGSQPTRLKFDWWANFNGPAPGGGSGSTQLSTFGLGTSGTVAQWPGGSQDSIWFAATVDGNSSSDWRAYSPGPGATSYPDASPVYAAGAVAGNRNNSNAYYAGFGGIAAPAAQAALYPQQTGLTLVGSAAYAWHQVVIENDLTNVTWRVDGLLIATVPATADTVATGNNIFFGHSDTNATSSTDVNDVNLLFTLIDNVVLVPEPSSLLLSVIVSLGALAIRRRP